MFYPSSAGTVAPIYPAQNHYYNAPMTAVLPGQQYYPTMHAAPMMYPQTAAPIMMQPQYGYAAPSYYGGTPTMVLPMRGSRHHRSSRRGYY